MKTMPFKTAFYKTLVNEISDGVYCLDKNNCISMWNHAAERITGYKEKEVIGRRCNIGILQHVSRDGKFVHNNQFIDPKDFGEGMVSEQEFYVHHKRGQLIPILSKTTAIHAEAGRIIGTISIFQENSYRISLKERNRELEKLALMDPLTKVGNRRYAEINIDTNIEKYSRYGIMFGLLFIDIDHFKEINDIYGHTIGDRVLATVAGTLKYSLRTFDIIARWGGEEFLVIVTDTNEHELGEIAERTRKLIACTHVKHGGHIVQVTASIGATIIDSGDTLENLVNRADKLMYRSKSCGRNRVSGSFPILF
jgi:diguanylate cyclase (GGDEF)-like protein/PAS domain S-box-containing protein